MIGWLDWTEGERQRGVREVRVLGTRLLKAEVLRGDRTPEAVVRRRVTAAARRMRRAGVTRAVLPSAFTYGEQLAQGGVVPISTLPLRRLMAAEWAQAEMRQRGFSGASARVAVAAGEMTGELVRTVTELCLRNRYVLLDVPRGGEELRRRLQREYGVSLVLSPTRAQMEEAECLLLFCRRTDLSFRNPAVLSLWEETGAFPPLLLPPALEAQLPEGADRLTLLEVLRESGAVRPGQIALGPCAGP